MSFFKNIKYKEIIVLLLIIFIGYKVIDNYPVYLLVLKKFMGIIAPFMYAIVFAYILNPIMKFFERRIKLNRGLAVLLTYLVVLGIIVVIALYGIPSIIESIFSITKEIPDYVNMVQNWLNSILKNARLNEFVQNTGLMTNVTSLSSKAGTILVSLLEGTTGSLITITTNIIKIGFGFLISIYMLLDKERFLKQIKLVLLMITGEKIGRKILNFVKIYNYMIGTYIGIKALDSLIIGVISLVGLIILRLPYAPLLALVVGVTNMIPYFGPFVGMLTCAVVALFITPFKALVVFIFLLALQQFDSWYLEPKLVSGKVGIGPFWVILGVTIGGGFFGPLGMILASPTVATIKIYYKKIISKYKEKHEKIVDSL